MQPRWYRVQAIRTDGTLYLSRSFSSQAEADRWARFCRLVQDYRDIRVIARPEPLPAA